MLHIEKEIAEQPDVIRRLLAGESQRAATIARSIREFDPAFVMIAARGTSDNAARYAQYLMGIQARLPVALATPSVHTLYGQSPDLSRALVIGISQSGQSVDVGQVVSDAQAQGAITVSITNDPESPMAQSSAFHLPLHCEEEISIAATKTYTAELTAIAMLVTSLVDRDDLGQELTKLPDYVAETVRQSQAISNWVQRYRYMDHVVVIGRGYNYCTAFEISLKIKELCYVTGEEYSEADFRHGPIAVIQPGFPVIVVAPEGKPLPGLIDLLKQLRTKQAECIVISNNETALSYGENITQLPEIPEWLSPVVSVIPGQVFAMRLALTKGHTVDRPEGLTKVTITR